MVAHSLLPAPDASCLSQDFQILVVEDDPTLARVIECVLEGLGHCHLVSTGLDAHSWALELQPDLILLDVVLPGKSGYQICRQLKKDPLTAYIPVIFLTSRKDLHEERKGLRLGAIDFINKPVPPDLLRLRVGNHLQATARVRQLHRDSCQDALTGIGNRRVLDASLQTGLQLAAAGRLSLSLVLLDVDYFKDYNDSCGHWAGDQVLKSLAKAIKDFVSPRGGQVARYGGEEFAIVFRQVSPSELEKLMQQLCGLIQNLNLEHPLAPAPGVITASLGGVHLAPGLMATPAELVNQADRLLYSVKQQGRNHYRMQLASVEGGGPG
ncbi:diguanylate cyclase domain-containing protein [Marinospirillum perlucidum]|uniref:diguanylate cyclase domain-containing protein n=1 Tax=Marinospirillum perlucidum TaxID=1982602 RepID=UPI000DF31A11|nr:diguanylate cyclase [Marinospirillum perlucidum]